MPEFDAELDQTVQMIWSIMFGPELALEPGPPQNPAAFVTGFVIFEGAFEGAILLRCSPSLAETVTDVMFDTTGAPSGDDLRDAIGEVSNMLAGNVKSVLPHPTRIGLPVVALGSDYDLQVVGTEIVGDVGYRHAEEQVRVTLVQQSTRGDHA